jgi:hypothetical protein
MPDNLPSCKCAYKRGIIGKTGAADIDEAGTRLHQPDPALIHQQFRFRCQRCREQDEIGKRQGSIESRPSGTFDRRRDETHRCVGFPKRAIQADASMGPRCTAK